MKLSFMTLGCPTWDLETICRRAREYGFDGVDFRGLGNELDVTKLPEFTTNIAHTRRMLADHGLTVSGMSSSIRICVRNGIPAAVDEAKRTIDVAASLGAEHIRVFGGESDGDDRADSVKFGKDCIQAILAIPGARERKWNLETHDHWTRSADCKLVLNGTDEPAFGVLWDLSHTQRLACETAQETIATLGQLIRYVHIKDAIHERTHPNAMHDGWRYVLPGQGQIRLADGITALTRQGYDGWFTFEHEKRWHPELEEPEIAFPAFVEWTRRAINV